VKQTRHTTNKTKEKYIKRPRFEFNFNIKSIDKGRTLGLYIIADNKIHINLSQFDRSNEDKLIYNICSVITHEYVHYLLHKNDKIIKISKTGIIYKSMLPDTFSSKGEEVVVNLMENSTFKNKTLSKRRNEIERLLLYNKI